MAKKKDEVKDRRRLDQRLIKLYSYIGRLDHDSIDERDAKAFRSYASASINDANSMQEKYPDVSYFRLTGTEVRRTAKKVHEKLNNYFD